MADPKKIFRINSWSGFDAGNVLYNPAIAPNDWKLLSAQNTILARKETPNGVVLDPADWGYGVGNVNGNGYLPAATVTFPSEFASWVPPVGDGSNSNPIRRGVFFVTGMPLLNVIHTSSRGYRAESRTPDWGGATITPAQQIGTESYWTQISLQLTEGGNSLGAGLRAYDGARLTSIVIDWGDGIAESFAPGADKEIPAVAQNPVSHLTEGFTKTHDYYTTGTVQIAVTLEDSFGRITTYLRSADIQSGSLYRFLGSAPLEDGIGYIVQTDDPFTARFHIFDGEAFSTPSLLDFNVRAWHRSLWRMRDGRLYANLAHPDGIPFITQTTAAYSDDRGVTWDMTLANIYGQGALYSSTMLGLRNGGTACLFVQGASEPFSLWYARSTGPLGNFQNPLKLRDIPAGSEGAFSDPNPIWYLWERPDGRLLGGNLRDTWIESKNGRDWHVTLVNPIFDETFLYCHGTVLVKGGIAACGVQRNAVGTPAPGEAQEYLYSLWFRFSHNRTTWSTPLLIADVTKPEPWHVGECPDDRLILSNGYDRVFESRDAGRTWIELSL